MPKLEFVSSALYVRDRRAALAWYVDNLGARSSSDEPEHWTTVRFGTRGPDLHLCEKGSGKKLAKSDVGESGLQLQVAGDYRAACKALAAKGVKFSVPPKKYPWGWVAKFLDLDGNELWLTPKG
jgi:uncharacterized glyoxalase superfamily protein PhnB